MKSKKAQSGPIGAIILFIFFVIMLFVWLGKWLADVGQGAVNTASLTGVEAFFFSNLTFIVIICMLLGMLGWMYFGSSQ